MKIKRAIMVLAVVTVVILSGCSEKNGTNGSSQAETSPVSTSVPATMSTESEETSSGISDDEETANDSMWDEGQSSMDDGGLMEDQSSMDDGGLMEDLFSEDGE